MSADRRHDNDRLSHNEGGNDMSDTNTLERSSLVDAPVSAIESVTLEVPDPPAAEAFYAAAFGELAPVGVRAAEAPSTGFVDSRCRL